MKFKYFVVMCLTFYSSTYTLFKTWFKNEAVKNQSLLLEYLKNNNPPYENMIIDLNQVKEHIKRDGECIIKFFRVAAQEEKHDQWSLQVIDDDKTIEIINPRHYRNYYNHEYHWYIRPLKPGIAQVRAQYHSEHKELEQTQEFSITITE